MEMQDIWKLKKKNIVFGQGLFTLTEWQKEHEWENGSDGEMGVLVPTLFHWS